MSGIAVYGIPNCDTIKNTLDWFKNNNTPVVFHDYKKEGISKEKLTQWSKQAGWQTLLNKKSTTWRGLNPEIQAATTSQAAAIRLMKENTSIIKRPVIEYADQLFVGFDEATFKKIIG